ncbi:MAG: hypothetical protein CL534_21985 [Ahrensia sp.]|nr:hypothetical protein [Ahrensia sp.]
MRHKDTVALYDYWNEMRGEAPAPTRSRIAPAGLGQLLPSVMLLDRTDADDFVFRIAGSRLCSLHCGELKGARFADIFLPEDRQGLTRIVNSVDRGNSVVVLDIRAKRPGGTGVSMEVGLFPLAGGTTRIMGIASAFSLPDWWGMVPAMLELRGVRHMNPDAGFAFLQSRPSIPILRRRDDTDGGGQSRLHVIDGNGKIGPARAIRAFRVVDGGKK